MAQFRWPDRYVTLSRFHAALLEVKSHMFAKLSFSNLVGCYIILRNCTMDRFSVLTLLVVLCRLIIHQFRPGSHPK